MLVHRASVFVCSLLVAGCAGQADVGNDPVLTGRATARWQADYLADGTPIIRNRSVKGPSTPVLNRVALGRRHARSAEDRHVNESIGKPKSSVAGSQPPDTAGKEGILVSHSQRGFETPVKGSDRWKKEEEENAKLDKQLNERLKNAICRRC